MKGDTGERGEQGPAGPQGVPGPVASNGRVVVWVDATGAVVGPEPVFIDDAGVRWPLDPESSEPILASTQSLQFEAEDCLGPALVIVPVQPRVAFRLVGDAGGVFVRPDDTTPAPSTFLHSFSLPNGNCSSSSVGGNTFRVLPLASLRAVSVPPAPFVGPLHQEWR